MNVESSSCHAWMVPEWRSGCDECFELLVGFSENRKTCHLPGLDISADLSRIHSGEEKCKE